MSEQETQPGESEVGESINVLGGKITVRPDTLVARYSSEDFTIAVSGVERVSKSADGATLIEIGNPLRASLLIEPGGYVYYRKAGALGIPAEPRIAAEAIKANGTVHWEQAQVSGQEAAAPQPELEPQPAPQERGSERVSLVGRIGYDPVWRNTRAGTYGRFSLAVKDESDTTKWHNCTVGPKVSPKVQELSLKTGEQLMVIGYPAKETVDTKGTKPRTQEVIRVAVAKRPKD